MPELEVIKKEELPESNSKHKVDYERELYINKIAEFLCEDNAEVRQLIRQRLKGYSKVELVEYAEKNNVELL